MKKLIMLLNTISKAFETFKYYKTIKTFKIFFLNCSKVFATCTPNFQAIRY